MEQKSQSEQKIKHEKQQKAADMLGMKLNDWKKLIIYGKQEQKQKQKPLFSK